MKSIFTLTVFTACCFSLASCKKDLPSSCYDKAYHDEHRNDFCTADCPGVSGCDGNTYCNECVMHSNGIKHTK